MRLHHAPHPPECGVHYLCSARPLFALNGLGANELAPTKDQLRDSLTVATFVHMTRLFGDVEYFEGCFASPTAARLASCERAAGRDRIFTPNNYDYRVGRR